MQTIKPNALTLLMFRYQSPVVPLERVIADFFTHMDYATAKKRAAKQDFPFPVFKAEKSVKAPFLVSIEALALYLDKQAQIAQEDFNNLHGIGR